MRIDRRMLVATLLIAGVALAGGAQAAKFKVLHSFGGERLDGENPQSGLTMDAAGNLFGTTAEGGVNEHGTAFELERRPSGALHYKQLFRFCRHNVCTGGGSPTGPLIVDVSGNLYGTAGNVFFELSPGGKKRWDEKILYNFCSQPNCADGDRPLGGLTYAGASSGAPYDGVSPLYGVTQLGGAKNGGAVFELTNNSGDWTESLLYSFCSQGGSACTDGNGPSGALLLDGVGNLFGLTYDGGGQSGVGVVFQLSPGGSNGWTETVLYEFCSTSKCRDGAYPVGNLAMDSAGNLYGMTESGGNSCLIDHSGCGTVFKVLPAGAGSQESVLYSFCGRKDCRDGGSPQAGLLLDASGNLFGTTSFGGGNDLDMKGIGGGVAFELSATGYKVLHSFCSTANCADGEYPLSGPVLDALSGRLLGTTSFGGEFENGTAFALTP